jgi:hypothetical protein
MNATIISRQNVSIDVLDVLATELPAIVAGVMEVPGGSLARVKPSQISLEFCQASLRDVGADIRIMVYARRNDPRVSTENERAKAILDKVVALITMKGEECSVDIRLYLMEIGAAEYALIT